MQDSTSLTADRDASAADLGAAAGAARWPEAIPSAAVALGVLILVLADSSLLFSDPDSIWHVAVGRWIWAHGRVPSVDIFSHTFEGAPWIAKEWLSQLILFAAHAAAGWWGVAVLAAAVIAAAFVILHEWLRRRLRLGLALPLACAAILLGLPHFLARPHVLVLPVIALWMSALVSAAEGRRAPPAAAALLMVAWANMHGSFPLGLGLAALFAAEAIVFAAPGTRMTAWRRWGLFLILCGAASVVSPYGWHAIVVPLTVGGADTLRYIDEWKSLQLDTVGLAALAVLATAAVLLLRDARHEAFRLVAILLLGVMMIRHARFISLFGLLAPFFVARVLATRWGGAARRPASVRPELATALAAPLAVALLLVATMRPAPLDRIAPERAMAFAQARGLSGPVYNAYDFGGFLIGKGIKTFVDGRTDQLFLGPFMPGITAALEARDDRAFAALLAAHGVTWALVKPRSRDAAHLSALPGWSRLYIDDVAAVYAMHPAGAEVRGRGQAARSTAP